MKNIKVNLDIILAMNPCSDRIDNYRNEYGAVTFTLIDFLELDKITAQDKQWVIRRLPEITQDFWIIYALDCAFSVDYLNTYNNEEEYRSRRYADAAYAAAAAAAAYAAAAYAADAAAAAYAAAAAAAYAADAAAYAAAYAARREEQIDCLIYLINNWE